MTIKDAIDRVDEIVANEIPEKEKRRWLRSLDGILAREVHRNRGLPMDCGGEPQDDTVLLVPFPYNELYIFYLEMRICDANGEITRYNNAMQKYNRALLSYMDYVSRTYPAAPARVRLY